MRERVGALLLGHLGKVVAVALRERRHRGGDGRFREEVVG